MSPSVVRGPTNGTAFPSASIHAPVSYLFMSSGPTFDISGAVNEILRQLQELIKVAKDPGKKLAELVRNAGKAMKKAVREF
jgi:hypothetical protein